MEHCDGMIKVLIVRAHVFPPSCEVHHHPSQQRCISASGSKGQGLQPILPARVIQISSWISAPQKVIVSLVFLF